MNNIKTFISCLFGPRLYSFYKFEGHTLASSTPEVLSRSHRFDPGSLGTLTDYVIRFYKVLPSCCAYISPMMLTYLYYKRSTPGSLGSLLDPDTLLKLFSTALSVLVGSFCLRGFSRYSNSEYLAFLKVLENVGKDPSISNKRLLYHFDAEFSAYPVDFRWSDSKDKRAPVPYEKTFPSPSSDSALILDNSLLKYPLEIIATLIMKTIGRRLVYPGSLGFLQTLMGPAISAGRSKLIEEHGGTRLKLKSFDGNFVDSMFIDRRGSSPNGDYLVIGCEGNGGFYEIGTILTPLEAGYSVLGWNHPGFGGSTGVPYPDQEVASIDTVIKFALEKLSFAPNQVIVYGWSIGGFTASWAGMRYPNIHGLVIDASFDHILPLARANFPSILYPIIQLAIKKHFDLDNSRHFSHFEGPVLLIRRSQDEVIVTDPYNSPPTNRANYLLIDILRNRFPRLFERKENVAVVHEYLGGNTQYQNAVLRRYSVNNSACLRHLFDYFHTNPTRYPVNIGDAELDLTSQKQLALYLASKHLIDYDSVHCSPLPARYFQKPWNLINLALNDSRM